MKEVCKEIDISYENLRFYCNEGLVPNVKRDKNNYRNFDERNIKWIKSLMCLKKCNMSLKDMKKYMDLCLEGRATIPERKSLLEAQHKILIKKIEDIYESIHFIEGKQRYYDEVLEGKMDYTSNLLSDETQSG